MIDWSAVITAEDSAALALAEFRARQAALIDAHVEGVAHDWGYNSAAHLASYSASTVEAWAREAQAFVAWRDLVWLAALKAAEGLTPGSPLPEAAAILPDLPEAKRP